MIDSSHPVEVLAEVDHKIASSGGTISRVLPSMAMLKARMQPDRSHHDAARQQLQHHFRAGLR